MKRLMGVLLGSTLSISAGWAQDMGNRTEESAQAFLSQAMSGNLLLYSNSSYETGFKPMHAIKTITRDGRCVTKFGYADQRSYQGVKWGRVTSLSVGETKMVMHQTDIDGHPSRFFFDMTPYDSAMRKRIETAFRFLIDTCDSKKATGF